MITAITVWLLVAVSDGSYNYGTVAFKEFADVASCQAAAKVINDIAKGNTNVGCVSVRVWK